MSIVRDVLQTRLSVLLADGPVLSQTDLYLLGTELELHPILANDSGSFQLIFNLSTGERALRFLRCAVSSSNPFRTRTVEWVQPRIS